MPIELEVRGGIGNCLANNENKLLYAVKSYQYVDKYGNKRV